MLMNSIMGRGGQMGQPMAAQPATPNPGAESQSFNPYANGVSIPGTGANGSATTFQDFWNPATNSWAIHQGADGAIAPIYTSAQWHNPQTQSLGLGSNQSINGGQMTINNKGGGSTQVGYAVDPKTGYIVPVTSQGIGQSSWWQSTGIPVAATVAALAAGGAGLAAAGAFGGAGALAGGLGAADAGAGLTAADLAGTTAGLGDLTSIAAPTFSIAGDAAAGVGAAGSGVAGANLFDPGYGAMINGTANGAAFDPAVSSVGNTIAQAGSLTDASGGLAPALSGTPGPGLLSNLKSAYDTYNKGKGLVGQLTGSNGQPTGQPGMGPGNGGASMPPQAMQRGAGLQMDNSPMTLMQSLMGDKLGSPISGNNQLLASILNGFRGNNGAA